MNLIYQVFTRFFKTFNQQLNKNERDQPLPLTEQRKRLLKELENIDRQLANHQEYEVGNSQL